MILFDNFNDYYSPIIKQRNVEYLEKKYPLQILDATLIIIRGSINDEELLKMIFQKYKITHIAHLAVSFLFKIVSIRFFFINLSLNLLGTRWCSFFIISNPKLYGNELYWHTNFT